MQWMIRMDTDGVSYNGFTWQPKGEWTEALDWNEQPECGGGLHGQNEMAWGFVNSGNRIVLCEYEGKAIKIDNIKIKVKRAKIIAINEEIPAKYFSWTSICLMEGATLHLPQAMKIGGYVNVEGGGTLHLPQVVKIGRDVVVHKGGTLNLPQAVKIGGYVDVREGGTLHLPKAVEIGGYVNVEGGGTLHLPQVVKIGRDVVVHKGGTLNLPQVAEIRGVVNVEEGGKLNRGQL